MKGGFGNLMKQAQEMQASLEKAQRELADMEVTGESGGGLVRVTMNGRHDVRRVSIDPSLGHDDLEMIEDLVAAAFNDAVQKVEAGTRDKFAGLAGGLNLPGNLKLPL